MSAPTRNDNYRALEGGKQVAQSRNIYGGNLELAKYLATLTLCTFADRIAQIQLLSFVVLSGPRGEGQVDSTLALLLPFVVVPMAAAKIGSLLGRKPAIVVSLLGRAAILLAAPAVFVNTGAAGMVIPSFVFALGVLIAAFTSNSFNYLPRETKPNRNNGIIMASVFASAFATLLALYSFQFLGSAFLPVQALRLCAVPYLVAAAIMLFVKLNRRQPQFPSTSFSQYIKVHRKPVSEFLHCSLLAIVSTAHVAMLTVLVMQNVDFNGATTFSLFQPIALGFAAGAVICMLGKRFFSTKHVAYLGAFAALITLASMAVIGTLSVIQPLFTALGMFFAMSLVGTLSLQQKLMPSKFLPKSYTLLLTTGSLLLIPAIYAITQVAAKYSAYSVMKGLNGSTAVVLLLLLVCWPSSRHVIVSTFFRSKSTKPAIK